MYLLNSVCLCRCRFHYRYSSHCRSTGSCRRTAVDSDGCDKTAAQTLGNSDISKRAHRDARRAWTQKSKRTPVTEGMITLGMPAITVRQEDHEEHDKRDSRFTVESQCRYCGEDSDRHLQGLQLYNRNSMQRLQERK